jgi:hypothetical protein
MSGPPASPTEIGPSLLDPSDLSSIELAMLIIVSSAVLQSLPLPVFTLI